MTVFDLRPLAALRESGRDAEASAWLAAYLAGCPADAQGLADLGEGLRQRHLLDDALTVLQRAIDLQPELAGAWINYGAALQQAGRLPEAKDAYWKAISLQPDSGEVASNLGALLVAQGDWPGALAQFDRAFKLLPHRPEIGANRAVALSVLQRFPEAVEAAQLTLEMDPKNFRAAMVMADAARRASSWSESETWFRRAAELNPRSGTALMGLGNSLLALERREEALTVAIALSSGEDWFDFPVFELGAIFLRLGERAYATRYLRRYLELDPSDAKGARLLLAAAGADLPARASETHLQRLYTHRAEVWGTNTVYPAAELIVRALTQLEPGTQAADIADLGCGTGPVGALVRHRARRLDGVDLSPPMLAKAKALGIYDELVCEDLLKFLAERPLRYDVLASAATLIHFGDLSEPFGCAAGALRPGGLFIFTLFPNETNGVAVADLEGLAQGGCFSHGRSYVVRVAQEAGFSVALLETDVHERHGGKATLGLVVALRRP